MSGILINQNTFSIEGTISHAYQTLCELHLGNEGHPSYTQASAITITNNQIHIPSWRQGNKAFFTLQKQTVLGETRSMMLHNFEMWGNQYTNLTPPVKDILLSENIDFFTYLDTKITKGVTKQQVELEGTWTVRARAPETGVIMDSKTYYKQATFSGKTVPIINKEPFRFNLSYTEWQQAETARESVLFKDASAITPINVKNYAFLPTITLENYVLGDTYIKGVYTGPAVKVTLFVNGVAVRNVALNANGGTNTLTIYASDLIKHVADLVEVALYDAERKEIVRQRMSVNDIRPAVLPSPYIFGANSIIGIYTGAGESIRLYVNDSQVKIGELNKEMKSFAIWAAGFISNKVDKVEAVLLDINGREIARSSVIINEMASLKVDSYLITSDEITGTYTGLGAAIQLRVNDSVVTNGILSEETKQFVFKDAPKWVTMISDKVKVELLNTTGNVLISVEVVLVDPPSVTSEPYTWHNQIITGTYRGLGETVQLHVNDVSVKSAAVNPINYTFSIWAQGLLPSKEAMAEIVLYDKNKLEIARTRVVVTDPPSISPKIYIWRNPTITGTYTGLGASVTLYANAKVIKTAKVNADNTFSIWADSFIEKVTDLVEIALVDSNGKEIARSKVLMTVVPSIKPDIYLWGTTSVSGSFTGNEGVVKYVKLLENGKQINITGGLAFATNSFSVWSYNVIKNKASFVEVVLCDSEEKELTRATVTMKNPPSIKVDPYRWKSQNITGSYVDTDELVAKVRLLENGKVIATGALDVTKKGFVIYAGVYIISETPEIANLMIALYDSKGTELVKNTVTTS
ncbi:hypothetical protein CMALT394_620008 [Carnobacterium maltaromaticum]|nr:hypothetical protein CMALT394_620008 [Carnobacterium maltaromaticum]